MNYTDTAHLPCLPDTVAHIIYDKQHTHICTNTPDTKDSAIIIHIQYMAVLFCLFVFLRYVTVKSLILHNTISHFAYYSILLITVKHQLSLMGSSEIPSVNQDLRLMLSFHDKTLLSLDLTNQSVSMSCEGYHILAYSNRCYCMCPMGKLSVNSTRDSIIITLTETYPFSTRKTPNTTTTTQLV